MRESIPYEQVAAFIDQLGIEPADVQSLEITPSRVVVHQYRLNGSGARYAVGGEAAMVSTDIPIERTSRDGADEA
ncbi:hypothetical protein [Streptomyces sp. NPDC007094]|uniref:hypothetical protein n=1 Tax=Streptomyces sp. NPDC007094 TaxID=3155359 RepID=UPI0033C5EFC0